MQLTLTELTSENRFSRKYYKSGHFVSDEYENECLFTERFWATFSDVKKGKDKKMIERFIIQRGWNFEGDWILDDIVFFKRKEAEEHLKFEIEESEFLKNHGICLDNRERYTHKVLKKGGKYVLGERIIV